MNRLVLIGAAAVATVGAGLAIVSSLQEARIEVRDARVVLATDGRGALAYLTAHNTGSASDRLISVTAAAAAEADLHSHDMADAADGGPVIDAGAALSLSPDGLHVLLTGLDGTVVAGAATPMTLTFERAGDVAVEATVIAAADAPAGEGHAHHQGAAVPSAMHAHAHDELVEVTEGETAPAVAVHLMPDPGGGWNLHVMARNFTFAPESVNGAHVHGQGHAHLYLNGDKIARLYGPWFHIAALPPGEHTLSVTLNANDHRTYGVGGEAVEAAVAVNVE